MSFVSYVVLKQNQVADALEATRRKLEIWNYDFEDFTILWFTGMYSVQRGQMREAGISFAACVFQGESIYPHTSQEVYYDRDGIQFNSGLLPDENQQLLYYNAISAARTRYSSRMISRMATTLSGHNTWGDVRHNRAMFQLRQTLLG